MEKGFPKTAYLATEDFGDGEDTLLAYRNPQEVAVLGEVKRVGIYELKEVVDVTASVNVGGTYVTGVLPDHNS